LAGFFALPASAAANVYAVAYMGTNHDLWYFGSTTTGAGDHDSGLGMDPNSSPAIELDVNGEEAQYLIAFESNANQLWLYYPSFTVNPGTDTGVSMEPGTSPAIADNDVVAYEGSNGHLWYWNGSGHDTGLGMAGAGTSPSITSDGTYIAFKASGSNHLWVYDVATQHGVDTGLGMAGNSSPSIGDTYNTGGYLVAFQASTGDLWYYNGTAGVSSGLGMAAGTSPSVSRLSGLIAFQANTGKLWLYDAGNSTLSTSTSLGMAPGSSPSLGLAKDSSTGVVTGYQVWFKASGSDDLWQYQVESKVGVGTTGVVSSNSVAYSTGVWDSIG
jgi:hypothetical protein